MSVQFKSNVKVRRNGPWLELSLQGAAVNGVSLLHIYRHMKGRTVYKFKGTEATLVAAGLMTPDQLPGSRRGAHAPTPGGRASRCQDGQVNICIYADIAIKADTAFQSFMRKTLEEGAENNPEGQQ